MKKPLNHKEALLKIAKDREFSHLATFSSPSFWEDMDCEEKELLATLFVMQGEELLLQGDNKVLESFKLANQICTDHPQILYRQGMAFAGQESNAFCLKASVKIFERILNLRPDFFDAWHGMANVLTQLGSLAGETPSLSRALETYEKANECASNIEKDKLAVFHRDWGHSWFSLGKLSEEACDFKNAVLHYQQAHRRGLSQAAFFNDYGNALAALWKRINRPELLIEGLEYFWKAIKLEPKFTEGWINLSNSLQLLYQIHPQEAYYTLAKESYDQAVKFEPENGVLWSKWAKLEAYRGKYTKDPEQLKEACNKFEVADFCDPNHPEILADWGEVLILLGSWQESYELLRKAEAKLVKSLEIQQDQPNVWRLYGNCLNEIGKYFSEESYYWQAIEKFKFGLRFNNDDGLLWYGLANSYFALGQLSDDAELIEQASRLCMKVIEKGGHVLPQFWNDWGVTLMKLAQITDDKRYVESALQKFERAIRTRTDTRTKEPLEPEWLYNYGSAMEFLADEDDDPKRLQKALQVFHRVMELDPYYYPALFSIATAHTHLGEITSELDHFHEAFKYFEEFLANEPEDEHGWMEWGISLIIMAQLVDDPSRPNEAKNLFLAAEDKLNHAASLGNGQAMYYLGCLHSLKGNTGVSIHCLSKAFASHSLPSMHHMLRDDWLENVRRTPEFQRFLARLEENEPSS